jgi:hypothetical protein
MIWLALAAAALTGAVAAVYLLYRLVLGAPFEDGGGFRGSLKRVGGRRRRD